MTLAAAWSSLTQTGQHSQHAADGQACCFEELYGWYYPGVLAFLRFLVGKPEVAEDLASLVFEKAWTHLAELRAETANSWLLRVARNCAVDYLRRCKPLVSLERLVPAEHPAHGSLEEIALAREEGRILLAGLRHLSAREREVIGLKFVVGQTNREIARVLQVPEGTIGSLLYRALRRLRAELEKEGRRL